MSKDSLRATGTVYLLPLLPQLNRQWKHPETCQWQCMNGGKRLMGPSLTSLKPSGRQIGAPAYMPVLVKAEPSPSQDAITQTHSSQCAKQQAEKCADMVCIPNWSQRLDPGLVPVLLNILQKPEISNFLPSFLHWAFHCARAEAWYRFEVLKLYRYQNKNHCSVNNGSKCSYLSVNGAHL